MKRELTRMRAAQTLSRAPADEAPGWEGGVMTGQEITVEDMQNKGNHHGYNNNGNDCTYICSPGMRTCKLLNPKNLADYRLLQWPV